MFRDAFATPKQSPNVSLEVATCLGTDLNLGFSNKIYVLYDIKTEFLNPTLLSSVS